MEPAGRPSTRRWSRREFLVASGALAVAACSDDDSTAEPSAASTTTTPAVPELAGDPFTLGVASGDPLQDRVVIWTRLAPRPLEGGGMPEEDVEVIWEVAADESFDVVVAGGLATAAPRWGHSVHVDAEGLEPDTWYRYRFRVGEWTSPVGRTRTAPAADATTPLRFGFASCQNYEAGYYTAHGDIAASEVDLLVFLGDYIYEYGPGADAIRSHNAPEVTDVVAYRNRYALYKSDPLLQSSHAACPWAVVWDDHEVENNYAGDRSEEPEVTAAAFRTRRADAYQAWWEHMPVRLDPPEGPDLEIFRDLRWGSVASLFLLDTRQYRDPQACGVDGISLEPACDEVRDPARSITGSGQEEWLLDGLRSSDTTWNVLGNQVVMTPLVVGDAVLNYDQWDGYPVSRERLLGTLASEGIANTVVVTGDIHVAGVGDLRHDGEVVATELVGTSISSRASLPGDVDALVTSVLGDVKYFNGKNRGWCRCTVTPDEWVAEYRIVADATVADSPVTTDRAFTIRPDQPGAAPA